MPFVMSKPVSEVASSRPTFGLVSPLSYTRRVSAPPSASRTSGAPMKSSVLAAVGSTRSVRLPTRTVSLPEPVLIVVGPAIVITLNVSLPP